MLNAWSSGTWSQHEIGLLQILWERLRPGKIFFWQTAGSATGRGWHNKGAPA